MRKAQNELATKVRIAVSSRIPSAVTFGRLRPVALLPPSTLKIEEEALRAVVLHELLHVRRRHFLKGLLEEGVAASPWFHAALRPFLREIRLAREQSVDRTVVVMTGERRLYLETLAAMARRRRGAPPVLLRPFFHRGHLLRRMASLTQEVTMTKKKRWAAGLLAGSLAVAHLPFRPAAPPAGALKAPGPGGVYEMGTLPMPKVLDAPSPVYPPEAKARGVHGRVTLEIVILESGDVAPEHQILQSPDPLLSAAAWEAVSRWKYEPTNVDGHPVHRKQVIAINFQLDGATGRAGGDPGPHFFFGRSSKVYRTPSVGFL